MSTVALDTSAVAAWVLQEEPRWRSIDALLRAPTADPVFPAPGLTELLTTVHRRGNSSSASLITDALSAMRVRTELLTEADLVRAAEIRQSAQSHAASASTRPGTTTTLSLADTLILAVVERLDCPVVTFDRYWHELASAGCTTARVVGV